METFWVNTKLYNIEPGFLLLTRKHISNPTGKLHCVLLADEGGFERRSETFSDVVENINYWKFTFDQMKEKLQLLLLLLSGKLDPVKKKKKCEENSCLL